MSLARFAAALSPFARAGVARTTITRAPIVCARTPFAVPQTALVCLCSPSPSVPSRSISLFPSSWFKANSARRRPVPPPRRRRTGASASESNDSEEHAGETETRGVARGGELAHATSSEPAHVGPTVINSLSTSAGILGHPALIISRRIEMMNLLVGFEQANQYSIMNQQGFVVGHIVEEDSFLKSLLRNVFLLHRKFTALVYDGAGQIVLRIRRPYYLINSRIFIETAEGEAVGEVQQRWHLWRRRYDLFLGKRQFAEIDSGFLAWEFDIVDRNGRRLARVDKDFTGFARELFTDARQYILKMDVLEDAQRHLLYDERAVALAAAITIDHDYFSLHSGRGGFMFWGTGGYDAE